LHLILSHCLHTIHYLLASHTPFVTNSALVATTVSLTLERDYNNIILISS
jgi:hypothetical protein